MSTPAQDTWLKDVLKVTVVEKPILFPIDGTKVARGVEHANESDEVVIGLARTLLIALHQDLHDRVGSRFRNEGQRTIGAMQEGPGDVTSGAWFPHRLRESRASSVQLSPRLRQRWLPSRGKG